MKRFRLLVAVGLLAGVTQAMLLPAGGQTRFANPMPITIPALGGSAPAPWPGNPYPSQIAVSGLTGTVTDLNLALEGFDCSARTIDFAYPEDVDILLVGPTGENLVALSDVGGANQTIALQFSDITVTLDDQAAAPLPADSQLAAGRWRPLDDDDDPGERLAADVFPAPAPAPSAATALSVFNGTSPNGTWSLYVADDFPGPDNCQILRGWTLEISTTSDPTTTTGPTTTTMATSTTTAPTTTTTAPTTTTTTTPPSTTGEGVWKTTAPLSVPRYDHTTTLLSNGQVLVAAGRSIVSGEPVQLLATTEVFDPRSERWRASGSLGDPRWRHTATLLPDGRVLVAGGFGSPHTLTASGAGSNAQPVLDTAEIFDPRTGTWTPTAAMATRRALHAATLLRDGKVLVAGGRTCTQAPPTPCNFTFVTDTAEVFDPATGTWAPAGRLTARRHTTAAALLPDGRVLLPAGFTGTGAANNTADLYDPATRSWSRTGDLNVGRARSGAIPLPGGRVLVASGFGAANTAEIYDHGLRTWSRTGNLALATARFNYVYAALPNGKVLVAGGATFPPASRPRSAELFDPASGLWASAGQMNDEHGSSSSLANSQQAVVLSSSPWAFESRPEACAPNCGKALVVGNSPTGTVEMYTPSCGDIPRPPQQSWCIRDGGAPGRSAAPGTPGETGPPEWTGAEQGDMGSPGRVVW